MLGAAVAVPLLPTGGYLAAAAVDPEAVELVCDNDGPQVCVTRVHAGLLPDLVAPARQALTMMAAKLPNAPTRAVEDQQVVEWAQTTPNPTRTPHQADTVVFESPEIGRDGHAVPDGSMVSLMLEAAWRAGLRR